MNVLLRMLAADPLHTKTVAEMRALLKTIHPAPVQGGAADRAFTKSLNISPE